MLCDNGEPSSSRVITFISVCGFLIAFFWWLWLASRIIYWTGKLPPAADVIPWADIMTVWVSFTAVIYGTGKLFAIPENLAKIGALKKFGWVTTNDAEPIAKGAKLPEEAKPE